MSYIVLARKYRPQVFDDIVGQSHVTTTLKNAISKDRLSHAYLFAGPRGVGKTTAARVLAKALNCQKGPSPKPCNTCASCKEIMQGNSLDVLEIDGASNRGIDEIRSLRDNVKFAPSKGDFKIYIIDEVHMLTAEAFNALLKTLEEPPPHVKFIFATTQAHKVPATILSRCQRFDFRRISIKDIIDNLKSISKAEGLKVNDEAIALIAKHSDGGMRNAQVVLDQITSFSKGQIGPDEVARILGIAPDEVLFGFSAAIKNKDACSALVLIDELINGGKDITQVVLGLIEHFRNICVAKIDSGKKPLIDAGEDKISRYVEEAKSFSFEDILYVIYTLSNTMDFIRKSSLTRIPFEAAMIKLANCSSMVSLDEILKRLDAMEGCAAAESKPQIKQFKVDAKPEITLPNAPASNPSPVPSSNSNIEDTLVSWKAVIEHLKTKKISTASFLQEGYPLSLEGKVLTIGFPKELKFHKETLEGPDNVRLIEESVNAVLKSDIKVIFELVEPANLRRNDGVDYPQNDANQSFGGDGSKQGKESDPIVKSALEMFGGSIIGKGQT